MVTAISVTMIWDMVYNVIKTQEVRIIANGDFVLEDFARFEKVLFRALQAVLSTLGGGQHGHA